MTTPRRGYPPRSRRISDWGLGPQDTGDQSITGNTTVLWNMSTTPANNITVVRTRGNFHVWLEAGGGTIGDGFAGAAGIYMMTEDAFAVGATAALDPVTDASSDMWIWHHFFDIRAISVTLGDGVNAGSAHQRIVIDSKAMRKDFDPDRVMVGVCQFIETGASAASFAADTRQLFKT